MRSASGAWGAERPAEPERVARRPSGVDPVLTPSEHKRAFSPQAAPAPQPVGVRSFRAAAVQAASASRQCGKAAR